jgi:hypothetical protein
LIVWTDFTWEAFATLVTGLSAVAAATFVGLRQVGIASRQSQILDRQVALADLGLREKLFERRFAIYEATKIYLLHIVQHADEPNADTKRAFQVALNEAEFLFSADVHARLTSLWKDAEKFFYYHRQSRHIFDTAGHYGDFPGKEHALLVVFSDHLLKLGEFFGDELKLSADNGAG